MRIDFSIILKNLQGKELTTSDPADATKTKPLTLGEACTEALLSDYQDERPSGTEKYERFKMAEKVFKGGVADFKVEELTIIKACVAKRYSPIAVGPIFEGLEKVIPDVSPP